MGINVVAAKAQASATVTVISDHGGLTGLTDDDHAQYALLAGRSGGQTLYGSPDANEDLTLQGSNQSGTSRGDVVIAGRLDLTDLEDQTEWVATTKSAILSQQTRTYSAAAARNILSVADNYTVSTNVFIYTALTVGGSFNQTIGPAFSTFVLFNANYTSAISSSTAFGGAFGNFQPIYSYTGSGTTTIQIIHGLQMIPKIDASTSTGGTINVPLRGLTFELEYDCATGQTVNFTSAEGLYVPQPNIASGGVGTGTIKYGTFYGVDYYGLGASNPTTRSAALVSRSREDQSNQRGLVTEGSGSVAAAPNDFLDGGKTRIHGLVLPGTGSGTLSTDQDDWDAFGWGGTTQGRRSVIRATPSADVTITGFDSTNADDGQVIILVNASLTDDTITISANDANSASSNRIFTNNDSDNILIRPNDAAMFIWETFADKWRCLGMNPVFGGTVQPLYGVGFKQANPTISTDQNNWTAPGFDNWTGQTPWVIANPTGATRTITGIDSTFAPDGAVVVITNISAQNLVLSDQNASSSAANRILTPTGADVTLGLQDTAVLMYDGTVSNRWRIVAGYGI